MPTGILPKINEAKEFLEIARNFKDEREIIREALSNSWDANAENVKVTFSLEPLPQRYWAKKIMVKIEDDGDGMDVSDLSDFFSLGYSQKKGIQIGTKGHGTKIYYKSDGIHVETIKNGKKIVADTEVPPLSTLEKGLVPTYKYEESDLNDPTKHGTIISIDGFYGQQTKFKYKADKASREQNIDDYVKWNTVVGSFSKYFDSSKEMEVELTPLDSSNPIKINFGLNFPEIRTDLTNSPEYFCKIFGPKLESYDDNDITKEIQIVGAVLGKGG